MSVHRVGFNVDAPEALGLQRLPGDASEQNKIVISASSLRTFHQAAKDLDTSIAALFLAGLACLISRLALQENVSIFVDYLSANASFKFDEDTKFGETLRSAGSHLTPLSADPVISLRYENAASSQRDWGMELKLREAREHLSVELKSPNDSLPNSISESWTRYLIAMVKSGVEAPGTRVKELAMVGRDEAVAFYERFNRTMTDYPDTLQIHDLFAEQVRQRPSDIAIVCGTGQLTYAEVDMRSAALASCLQKFGAGPGRAVALCMDRSLNMLVGLLAIVRSGSFYVPLDPQHPRQRLRSILEECNPIAVICDRASATALALETIPVVLIDEPLNNTDHNATNNQVRSRSAGSQDDIAYVIYTSGTTGKPKGVRIAHRSLVNLVTCIKQNPGFAPGDRMLAVATISFDMACLDMWLPITAGGMMVIADNKSATDPTLLAQLLEEQKITLFEATPTTWRMLVNSGWAGKSDLKMIIGGEATPRDLANKMLPLGKELWNFYGPTETTVWSSILRLHMDEGIVPIGPAAAEHYVLRG